MWTGEHVFVAGALNGFRRRGGGGETMASVLDELMVNESNGSLENGIESASEGKR